MSEVSYKKCILASNAAECTKLLDDCLNGDPKCIEEFNKMKREYNSGMRFSEVNKEDIKALLTRMKIFPYISNDKTSDQIIREWVSGLGESDDDKKVKNNTNLQNILMFQVEALINPEFSGDPATMKTSKAYISPRPCSDKRAFNLEGILTSRPTPKKLVIGADGRGTMVGGGSRSQAKNLSYVNKIRYLDSLNTYYNMVGGSAEPTNCCNDLKQMYDTINNNLQAHGKEVEKGDANIIENMFQKFASLEEKVSQIQDNISKLSSVSGTNVAGVLESEKQHLKTESKYLSSQGKTITSVLRSLFESIDQVPISHKTLTNARLQFPQHTVTY